MTTVVFYKGLMGCDTLQTQFGVIDNGELDLENVKEFSLVKKIYTANGHILGFSGDVNGIVQFIEWFESGDQNYLKFKPNGKFSIIDWDGENLVAWWTGERFSPLKMLLGLFTWDRGKVYKTVLNRAVQSYDKDEEAAYTIGSGEDFVTSAFSQMAFHFNRHEENISDHLTREEVIHYLIVLASYHDPFTNDQVYIENFTSVSPQNANLSKG